MSKHRGAVRARACRRADCRAQRAQATRFALLGVVDAVRIDRLLTSRHTLLVTAGTLAERLHASGESRRALEAERDVLRAAVVAGKALVEGYRQGVQEMAAEVDRLIKLLGETTETLVRVSGARAAAAKALTIVTVQRDASRLTADLAAEALSKGAEENRRLAKQVERFRVGEAEAMLALETAESTILKLQEQPLRFLPVEGKQLPDGDWVFRLPRPHYSNGMARRRGHIAAARVRAGLRAEGPHGVPPVVVGSDLASKPSRTLVLVPPRGFPGYRQRGH